MEMPEISNPLPDFSEQKFLSKKNLITLLIVGILLLAIPVGVKLAQDQQFLKSKATGNEIQFSGPEAGCDSATGVCTTTSNTVQVELRSPLGPPQP